MFFRTITLLIISLTAVLAQAHAASSMGAGVVWIPFENRHDFTADMENFDNFFSEYGERSFFHIPKQRYFLTSAKGDFQAEVRNAIKSLILANFDADTDIFLAIGIASHGSREGKISSQYGGDVDLHDFLMLVFAEADQFYQRTGRLLRIEILTDTCFSGNLITVAKTILGQRAKQNLATGPFTALTSTSSREESAVSLKYGSYVIRALSDQIEGAKKAAENFAWGEIPTLARFGYFRDFGAGHNNFPQVYSTAYGWSPKATLDFLDWNLDSLQRSVFSSDTPYLARELYLDFDGMLDTAPNVGEALRILEIKKRFRKNEKLPLEHTSAIVRRAAAIAAVNMYFDPHEIPTYSQLEQKLKVGAILIDWATNGDALSELAKLDDNRVRVQFINGLPAIESWEASIDVLRKLYKADPGGVIGRSVIDKLREILRIKFRLEQVTQDEKSKFMKNELPQSVPDDIAEFFVRAHMGLPLEESSGNRFKLATDLAIRLKMPLQACRDALVEPSAFERVFKNVLVRYDSGTYVAR